MPLSRGSTLGPYEIIKPAGAGGMGEVYKAKDTRLDRVVAIKVLPSSIADDAQLRSRFEREAKAISSLSHPNICTLYDVGNDNGTEYLVMEYLECKTLADRIAKGPLPLDDVLTIGGQIADALDKAHRQRLIHRDLKPSNVMLTKDGAKLLDFGLAKAVQRSNAGEAESEATQTALTKRESIVGTLQYMAPEQLQGKEADARSDIFAFGAVLYEMLTGKRAFDGDSKSAIIGAVLHSSPEPISEASKAVPPNLERLITKCLDKDPDRRWQTATDLGDELQWIARSDPSRDESSSSDGKRDRSARLAWGTAALIAVAAIVAVAFWLTSNTGEQPNKQVTQFTISPQQGQERIYWPMISPDGQLIAYQATDSAGHSQIWIRPIDSAGSYPLEGTEDVWRPFWSPDSRYLAFFADNHTRLMKIPVSGGPPTLICEANGADGSWGTQDVLLWDLGRDPLHQVSASGGTPSAATVLDTSSGARGHHVPHFLPDGEYYLFCATTYSGFSIDERVLSIGRLGSIKTRRLRTVGSRPVYSTDGYVLFMSSGVLFAHPFDPEATEFTGAPIPVTAEASTNEDGEYSVSNNGTLIYARGRSGIVTSEELVWFDRRGNVLGTIGGAGEYGDIALSPDGNKVAYMLYDQSGTEGDLWIHNLKQGAATRLTFDPGFYRLPVWSPDGTRLLFYGGDADEGTGKIYERRVDGTGRRELFTAAFTGASAMLPVEWNAIIQQLLCANYFFDTTISRYTRDIYLMDARDPTTTTQLTNTDFQEITGSLSPNGKYYAYHADPSTLIQLPVAPEIYVRAVEGDGQWQISSNGGRYPKWSPDGGELFYFSPEWDLMSVPVSTDDGFEMGVPRKLFRQEIDALRGTYRRYDVTPDGERFLMVVPVHKPYPGKFIVTENWTELLEERSNEE